ncbi:hypothetical protein [Hymenobacter ruber]
MDSLYTIIVDYKGGTYIEQVMARNESIALAAWIRTPHIFNIPGLGMASQQALSRSIADADAQPVVLVGMKNAWCTSFSVRGAFMLINIVRTVQTVQ